MSDDGMPPSGRQGGALAATVIAYIVLALSALICLFVVVTCFRSSTMVTCGDHVPAAAASGRTTTGIVTLTGYVLCVTPALWLLSTKRSSAATYALLLSFVAFFEPVVGLLFLLFTIAMC